MGYSLIHLDVPVFIIVLKPLLTEFDIHNRLESCGKQLQIAIFIGTSCFCKHILKFGINFRVWEYGGYASKGLEQVAKWGSPRQVFVLVKLNFRPNCDMLVLTTFAKKKIKIKNSHL